MGFTSKSCSNRWASLQRAVAVGGPHFAVKVWIRGKTKLCSSSMMNHWNTCSQLQSVLQACRRRHYSHALTHTPLLTCPYSHALTHMPLLTRPYSRALTHTPLLTRPYSHAHTYTPLLTCPYSHALNHTPLLTCPYSHTLTHAPLLARPPCPLHARPSRSALLPSLLPPFGAAVR